MHSIHYLLALLLIWVLCYPPPTLATETEDIGPNATSRDAVPASLTSQPRRRHLSATQILRGHPRRSSSDDTCPTDYVQCGSGLPSGFCCASGDSCLSLAGATTVLCCPEGEDCSQIEPITCSIAVQNATAYPTLAVHTTNLTGQLPTCGSGCCPFGYTCSSGSNICVRTKDETLITETTSAAPTTTATSATGTGTVLVMASIDATKSASAPTGSSSSSSNNDDDDGDKGSSSSSSSPATSSRTIGIAAGSAVAGVAFIGAIIAFAWVRRKRAAGAPAEGRGVRVSVSQFSPTPPPLPEKEPHQIPKRKRKSLLSWVPSLINRTPAELPATPVSFSAWNTPWGQGQVQRPNGVLRPYPRDSLAIEEVYELEARWLPQERPDQERHTPDMQTQEWYTQERYI